MSPGSPRSKPSLLPVSFAVALIAACLVLGGTSQAAAYTQFFIRSAAIVIGAAVLLTLDKNLLGNVKVPMLLCLAWTLLMLIQLIPLPPSWWTALPGREVFAELANVVGIEQPWR